MKVALICCGRLENRYAIEFIEYYKQLGFDHIYVMDNNHDNEEHFEDVLQSYVNDNFITIYDYRNIDAVQWEGYKEIYYKISDKYDYVFFCDFDEFLTLVKDNNIKDYLSRECFKDYNQILINWKLYSDNNLIYDDGRGCLERFTTESKYLGWKTGLVKQIIKTNIKDIYLPHTVHIFRDKNLILEDSSCNNCGEKIELHDSGCIWPTYELAYIKHFTTKTIDEYVNRKLKRGTADISYELFNQLFNKDDLFSGFFEINDITEEKINYLNKHNLKYKNFNTQK